VRTRVLSITLVVVSLALAVSACGGSDADEPSDASAGVVGQVESVCADWRETLDERGDFPVEGFEPESPAAEDLPAVGDYFASAHEAAEEAIAELRHLSPPFNLAADVETLISALEQQLESARVQSSAAQSGDVAAFTATLDDAASSWEAVREAAEQLGTPDCAF
jgi:hypothetical protein